MKQVNLQLNKPYCWNKNKHTATAMTARGQIVTQEIETKHYSKDSIDIIRLKLKHYLSWILNPYAAFHLPLRHSDPYGDN